MYKSNAISYFMIKNRTAVVTGGNGNLGWMWSKTLLEAGALVAVLDLKKIPISSENKNLMKLYPKSIEFYGCDVTDLKQVKKTHEDIRKDFGLITILVNNAGIDIPPHKIKGNLRNNNDTKLNKKVWDINVQGLVNCIEEFSSDMIVRRTGSIINIGSLYATRSPYSGLYSHLNFDKPWGYGASKAAVLSVSRHFATRLAKFGIRVNTLSPGGVYGNQDKEFIRKFSQRVPLGRMANKDNDLGGPLIFLASEASKYITGINLEVNGGYTAW